MSNTLQRKNPAPGATPGQGKDTSHANDTPQESEAQDPRQSENQTINCPECGVKAFKPQKRCVCCGNEGDPRGRFPLLTAEELAAQHPQGYRIKHIFPKTGTAAIYGPSGAGKSFLVLSICGAISTGGEWFGHRVKTGPVVYIVLEGEAGMNRRIAAYRTKHGGDSLANVRFMAAPSNLMSGDVEGVIRSIGNSKMESPLIFIDTLNRAAPGADENSSKDMGAILASLKALQAETGGLVVASIIAGKTWPRA